MKFMISSAHKAYMVWLVFVGPLMMTHTQKLAAITFVPVWYQQPAIPLRAVSAQLNFTLTGDACAFGSLQNFDEVLVPADHVSRNPNDTYYIDTETVLRCHTSAHQAELLRQGEAAFMVTGADFGFLSALLPQHPVLAWYASPPHSISPRPQQHAL